MVVMQRLDCANGMSLPNVVGRAMGGVLAPLVPGGALVGAGSVDEPADCAQTLPPDGGAPMVAGTPIRASPLPDAAAEASVSAV